MIKCYPWVFLWSHTVSAPRVCSPVYVLSSCDNTEIQKQSQQLMGKAYKAWEKTPHKSQRNTLNFYKENQYTCFHFSFILFHHLNFTLAVKLLKLSNIYNSKILSSAIVSDSTAIHSSSLSWWERWHAFSPMNLSNTSQLWASVSSCMQNRADYAFQSVCCTTLWQYIELWGTLWQNVVGWLNVSLMRQVLAYILLVW